MKFKPIEKHQLNPDEPPFAVAVFAQTSGEEDEFLLLTTDDGREPRIALSPDEAIALRSVINEWIWGQA